jgi:hypothetical protein
MATLGEQAVGNIVKLNMGGTATEFIVVHQGNPYSGIYDSSCDGTWLLIRYLYPTMQFGSDNNYKNNLHPYLNSTIYDKFDADIKAVLKNVKIPYTNDAGSVVTGAYGLSTYVFALSAIETFSTSTALVQTDGYILDYFRSHDRIAELDGTATGWWLRTPHKTNSTYMGYVSATGDIYTSWVFSKYGIRFAIVLPQNLSVNTDGLVIAQSKAITGTVPINGVQRELTGAGYININGVLRDLSDAQVNIGGTLKSLEG